MNFIRTKVGVLKECPTCGMPIRLTALKCKECGYWFKDDEIWPI